MISLTDVLTENIKKVALVGHTHPDGDCVGSCTAMFHYLTENFKEFSVDLYLEPFMASLSFLTEGICVREDDGEGESYDLVISLDASSIDRIGAGKQAFLSSDYTVCIDHHESNPGIAKVNHIEAQVSSCSEVLFKLLDAEKVSLNTAVSLYTGIIHDTGVFKYDAVTADTLRISAALIEKGVPFTKIIEETISDMDLQEMKIMGEVFSSIETYDGYLNVSICPLSMQEKYGLTSDHLGAIVSEMNHARNAEVTCFFYQYTNGTYKGSLRSKGDVNVAEISAKFGGGGHRKAAGFSIASEEEIENAIEVIRESIKEQLS